ncbi:STAS domain-containing protein [Nakamurella endophytica]|uniref:Anti-sigma factor antagonist n=1 Tax=Nakamurella endophytica TaxID=1748367 RepID=A0A917WH10_9ACTN|nr:STAS domain-containing protein [Nakamurella endophytica]GGM03440.1 anti-sigma factor antagonist [Nakamurella endophytica]
MNFDVDYPTDGAAVITAAGRLNMVAAPKLRELIATTVTEHHRPTVVVDLGATDFIDSSGLGALIAGLKTARSAGGDLRIARPGKQVTTVLQLTNMLRVLRPYPSVAESLA